LPLVLVSVCICTFKRPTLLLRLLNTLSLQQTQGRFAIEIVVADNDAAASARAVVGAFAARCPWPVRYAVETQPNIALARNCAVRHARGEFIAFVDDDEFVPADWLFRLFEACESSGAAGVLGPVRPHFEATPAEWIVRGRFCERREHASGTVIDAAEGRTGNVLLRRSWFAQECAPFRAHFDNGGEDKDFFVRLAQHGAVFVWCNEAAVHEIVPRERCTRRYMLRRALLRGKNNLKLRHGRWRLIARSIVATPIYMLLLPPSLLLGQHVSMRLGIRLCDHAGRLLAVVGLNPVSSR
jgi:glycosyltransferase involved in cell wall biosynthesis